LVGLKQRKPYINITINNAKKQQYYIPGKIQNINICVSFSRGEGREFVYFSLQEDLARFNLVKK